MPLTCPRSDLLTCPGHPSRHAVSHLASPIIPGHRAEGRGTRRAITSGEGEGREALRREVSVIFFFPGIFRREREKSRGALEACSIGAAAAALEERRVKNGPGRAEHCTLIDVSNPGRIVRAEINGARVKKQNTCLCCRSAHRR